MLWARMGGDGTIASTSGAEFACGLCPTARRNGRPRKSLRRCYDALDADERLPPTLMERRDAVPTALHQACALWCPEVYFDAATERLRNVREAVTRARRLRCHRCGERGAAVGCAIDSCPRSYHLVCAHEDGCAFAVGEFALACPRHVGRLARERPDARWAEVGVEEDVVGDVNGDLNGNGIEGAVGDGANGVGGTGAPAGPAAVATMAVKGATPILNRIRAAAEMNRGMNQKKKKKKRARLNDDRFMNTREGAIYRTVIEAGTRMNAERDKVGAIEDDDEAFRLRESRRLDKDKAEIPRVIIGGGLGTSEYSQGWESLAGMEEHVKTLKEMTLLPLTYPEIFERLGAGAARGVLLHGPPGTGKTAAVRAMLGAAARGPTPISFFSRLGADCLGKYSGEAERKLRLLFEEAEKRQPSIIFFDEIDGLAPARRGGGSSWAHDEIHSSVVATLLALMDGLSGRGSVVVIASTNRPDAVDAALRRPGRFDRELFFGLPDVRARAEILDVHTRAWTPRPNRATLDALAGLTEGCAGADLRAIANAALMSALRRFCPSLLRGDPTRDSLAAELEARLPPPESAQTALDEASRASASGHVGAQLTLKQFEALATRVRVYWPIEDAHHEATIVGYDRNAACHRLRYDDSNLFDGEEVWMQLFRPNVDVRVLEYDEMDVNFIVGGNPTYKATTRARVRETVGHARTLLKSYRASRRDGVSVSFADWQCALKTTSSACSARSASAALVPRGKPLDEYMKPLLGYSARRAVDELIKRGAAPASDDECGDANNEEKGSTVKSCRILLAGEGYNGQQEVMDVVLNRLNATSSHLVNLASLISHGDGDAARGVALSLHEPLRQAMRTQTTLVMPNLDLWALARTDDENGEEGVTTSALWDLVQTTVSECYADDGNESSGSLCVVASVGLPHSALPSGIRHFFEKSGTVLNVEPNLCETSISCSFGLAAAHIGKDVESAHREARARKSMASQVLTSMSQCVAEMRPNNAETTETSEAACEALRIRVRRTRAVVRGAIAKCVKELLKTRRFDRFFDRSEQAGNLIRLALDRKIGDPNRFIKDLRACAKALKPRRNTHSNVHKPVVSLGFNAVDTLESWFHLGVTELYEQYVEKDAEYDEALRRAATALPRTAASEPLDLVDYTVETTTTTNVAQSLPPIDRKSIVDEVTTALKTGLSSCNTLAEFRALVDDVRSIKRAEMRRHVECAC